MSEYDCDLTCAYEEIKDGEVTTAAMVDQLRNVIVDAYDGCWFEDYKSRWLKSIRQYLRNLNIPFLSKTPDWSTIASMIIEKSWNIGYNGQSTVNTGIKEAFKAPANPPDRPAASATASSSPRSSSNTITSSDAENDGESVKLPLLSAADKDNIAAKYAGLKKDCMWKLSTGTIVEEQMLKCAMDQTHEHMAHSLILNVNDMNWRKYFTSTELDEIRHHQCVEIPRIPDVVVRYLEELKGLTEEELYNKLTTENLHIDSHEKWIQDSFSQAIRLIKSFFIPINKTKTTEGGLLKRMWACIDTCYDFSTITCISGEICSKSSADAMNSMRSSLLCRQKPGRKMDFIFSYKDYEIGCGECGMDVATNSTKELSDCGHKMPKVMRDMLSKLVCRSPSLKRKLVISGYYIGEKHLKMVLLDTPVGYVTRYDALKVVDYPQDHLELYRQLSGVLRTILAGRMLMENTATILLTDDTEVSIGRRHEEEQMQPNFMPIGSGNKRRKRTTE